MRREAGFTLIELVMVMVLIGIIAIYALPRMQPDIFDLRVASQELAEALRYAQQQSMSNSGDTPYRVELNGSGYTVTQNGIDVRNPFTGTLGYSEDPTAWNGVTLAPAGGIITFAANGLPSCDWLDCSRSTGANALLTVTTGSDSGTLTIERFTGYVHN